jgi:hypothetical protein
MRGLPLKGVSCVASPEIALVHLIDILTDNPDAAAVVVLVGHERDE